MKQETERLDEWFNPHNPEHMQAYEVLCDTGAWPEGFVPPTIEVPIFAIQGIQAKMAAAWLHAMKYGQIIGSAPFDA